MPGRQCCTHACLQLQPCTKNHEHIDQQTSLHMACRPTIPGCGFTTATSSGIRSWAKAWCLLQQQTRSSQPQLTCQCVLSNATMTLQASHQLGWLSAMALPAMIFQALSQMCLEVPLGSLQPDTKAHILCKTWSGFSAEPIAAGYIVYCMCYIIMFQHHVQAAQFLSCMFG